MKYLLNLQGGGIRGIITAYFLLNLEKDLFKKTGKGIYDTFDMFSGTSVGAILVAAIVYADFENIDEIIDEVFTEKNFKGIFTKNKGILSKIMLRPIYSSKFKSQLLKEYLKDYRMIDTPKKVLIPVYSVSEQLAKFYKSYNLHKNCSSDSRDIYNVKNEKILIRDIVDASSSPPVYFGSIDYDSDEESRTGIDGAVFANDPSDCMLADAIRLFPKDKLVLINIGTGSHKLKKIGKESHKFGGLNWLLSGITDIMLDATVTTADYKTKQFCDALGHSYLLVQEPVDIPLDDIKRINDLIIIADVWYKKYSGEVLKLLTDSNEESDNPESLCSLITCKSSA